MSSVTDPAEATVDAASYIISSKYREQVVQQLLDGPSTPTKIAEAQDMEVSHASRALQELRDEDVTSLMVSDERRKGRIYGLTDAGEKAASFAEGV